MLAARHHLVVQQRVLLARLVEFLLRFVVLLCHEAVLQTELRAQGVGARVAGGGGRVFVFDDGVGHVLLGCAGGLCIIRCGFFLSLPLRNYGVWFE